MPFVCNLAAGHAHSGSSPAGAAGPKAEKSLQTRVLEGRPPARERHGDRTPSLAVMRCRLKRRTPNTAVYRVFPTGKPTRGLEPRTPSLRVMLGSFVRRMVKPNMPAESTPCATRVPFRIGAVASCPAPVSETSWVPRRLRQTQDASYRAENRNLETLHGTGDITPRSGHPRQRVAQTRSARARASTRPRRSPRWPAQRVASLLRSHAGRSRS